MLTFLVLKPSLAQSQPHIPILTAFSASHVCVTWGFHLQEIFNLNCHHMDNLGDILYDKQALHIKFKPNVSVVSI